MQKRVASTVRPPFEPRAAYELATQGVYLGTSSWRYRGWEGLLYEGGYATEAVFQRASLREYTNYLPCVGVDFTYYSWPMADMMAYLVDSTPEGFWLCPKVTKRITMSSFPALPAYGKWAGQKNPDYLSVALYQEKFHQPVQALRGRLGMVLFEFAGPEAEDLPRIQEFFAQIPREFPVAVEIRNPELVTPAFYRALLELEVSPALSLWTKMPPIADQWSAYTAAGGLQSSTPLVGLGILRPGRTYEEAVSLFQPYREMKDIYEEGLSQLAELGKSAMQNGRKAYILVNNRLEGSAPYSIGRIVERLVKR